MTAPDQLIELIHEAATLPLPKPGAPEDDRRRFHDLAYERLTAIRTATALDAPLAVMVLRSLLAEIQPTYPTKEQ